MGKMNRAKLENLKILSRYMTEEVLPRRMLFDMGDYVSAVSDDALNSFIDDPRNCRTSACLLGWGAHALGKEEELRNLEVNTELRTYYEKLSEDFFVGKDNSRTSFFLFSPVWDNSVKFAVQRLDFVIANDGIVPKDWGDDMVSIEEVKKMLNDRETHE